MSGIMDRTKDFFQTVDEKLGKKNALQKLGIYVDFVYEHLIHKIYMVDYFQYGFYYLNHHGRERYVTHGKLQSFTDACNNPDKIHIFKDKSKFIEVFCDYIGRDVLDMKRATLEQFLAYTQKHDRMFIKPADGSWGRGAEILECGSNVDNEALYNELKGKNILVEEVITQHPSMAEFNASSLNSIRVVTFVHADGMPRLVKGAVIRLGRKGKVADNFHHNGVGAYVDVETGVVITTGMDKTGNRHTYHPDSGKAIVGFKIPEWERICEVVKKAALVCPEVRYVGWDVAVTDDNRILLVEGNNKADPDLGQMSLGAGNWPVYKKLMDEVKKQ